MSAKKDGNTRKDSPAHSAGGKPAGKAKGQNSSSPTTNSASSNSNGGSSSNAAAVVPVQAAAAGAQVPVTVPSWLPPGADASRSSQHLFGHDLEEHFVVPKRLQDTSVSLVEAVNDFHFAMLADHQRNAFYKQALQAVVQEDDIVLEIGTGSGLLAMMAARAGAKHVYAIEANRSLAQLARQIIRRNQLADKITVINKMSTDVVVGVDLPRPADVMVSEILGTLLLGESALEFVADARERLLKASARIIPSAGCQFISLVQSEAVRGITSVQGYEDFDLQLFNTLQDTVSVVFTKQYGFRFSDTPHEIIVGKTCVADVNFYTDEPGSLPDEKRIRVKAEKSGVVDAVLTYWEAYGDDERTQIMSTDPKDTKDNFARDMQWGQALQLVEDTSLPEPGPHPLVVKEGDELDIIVRFSSDNAYLQFGVEKVQPKA